MLLTVRSKQKEDKGSLGSLLLDSPKERAETSALRSESALGDNAYGAILTVPVPKQTNPKPEE